MPLAPGTRLGPYEVTGPIGAGGMGEVYRARDTRLHRDVAIKVLPPAVSADPVRRKRFEIESRAIAALSHPHICPIHDVGAEGGLDYLVLELVDGETLAARLKRGRMPLAEVLARAAEIADAMATAHRRGIIHRDLKPGNIMLTKSGAIVLDFGLARIIRDEPAPTSGAAETMTSPLTEAGAVLGTLQYMAPEQIEGRPADARADVFAFGAILYEMLTARRAFEGSSAAAVMGAILRADAPSVVSAQPHLPGSVDRLVRACLVKDPADRIASMHDVKLALVWIQEDLSRGASYSAISSQPRSRARIALVAAGLLGATIAGVAGYWYWRGSTPASPPAPSYVYDVPLPASVQHYRGLALSRDGRRLALVTRPPNGAPNDPRLWIRDLDSTAAWQLVKAGAEVPQFPFWSPDGRSLAFFVLGHLVRVQLPSVVPVEICAAAEGRGGVWMDDGTIIFAPSPTSPLMRVDSRGGRPEELVPLKAGEKGLKYPSAAGNRRVIFWANADDDTKSELRLVSLDDPARVVPIVAAHAAGVYDTGTLFYLRAGLWVGQPFDPVTVRLSGVPRPITVDRLSSGSVGAPPLSAQAGHLAASNAGSATVQPTWFDRAGTVVGRLAEPGAFSESDISADGRRVVIAQGVDNADLWMLDADTGGARRLTTDSAVGFPVWSRDGKTVLFSARLGAGGTNSVYEVESEGPPHQRALVEAYANLAPVGWLGARERLVFMNFLAARDNAQFPRGILIRETPSGLVAQFRGGEEPTHARLSPDETRIAFSEIGFGSADLFVDTILHANGQPIRVWHGPAVEPRWSGDGRELYFVQAGHLMAAPVSQGPVIRIGTPVKLFDVPSNQYAVDPKTGRFLVMVPVSTPTPTVTVTLNWPRRQQP